jgi:hypothetical protein
MKQAAGRVKYQILILGARLEVHMKSSIFWDITGIVRRTGVLKEDVASMLHSTGSACCLVNAGFLLQLRFDPEDGGDMFLRNVG